MKPVPSGFLLALIVALCAVSAWQWHRESQLRAIAATLRADLEASVAQRDELETRAKAADAEILRLTGAVTDLRANSVSMQVHEEITLLNTHLREAIEKQSTLLKEQNEALAKTNAAILAANENVRKLTEERDAMAKRVNEVTALYNELAAKRK